MRHDMASFLLFQVLLATHANQAMGIPDKLFALTDSAVLSALGQLAFMPTLVLAARLCPPGSEGTLFASLMSVGACSGLSCMHSFIHSYIHPANRQPSILPTSHPCQICQK